MFLCWSKFKLSTLHIKISGWGQGCFYRDPAVWLAASNVKSSLLWHLSIKPICVQHITVHSENTLKPPVGVQPVFPFAEFSRYSSVSLHSRSTLLKLLQTCGLGCLLVHPPYQFHQALCCFTGVTGGREEEERSSTCFLFSLHALLATALLTSDCLYVYFGRDIRTVLEQWANQWNRTWQENMKVPSGGCWTEKWGEKCVCREESAHSEAFLYPSHESSLIETDGHSRLLGCACY